MRHSLPCSTTPPDRTRIIAPAVFAVAAVFIVVKALTPQSQPAGSPSPPPQPPVVQQRVVSPAVQVRSTVVKLAAIQTARASPEQSLIVAFDARITSLAARCPALTPTRIGDVLHVGWERRHQHSVPMTLFQVVKGVDDSIPAEAAGQVKCIETAAAWVTLTRGE